MDISPFTVVVEYVLDVSVLLPSQDELGYHVANEASITEQFALSNASYTIARLLKAFPDITLPAGTLVPELGTEKQILGLTLSSEDGCLVQLREE